MRFWPAIILITGGVTAFLGCGSSDRPASTELRSMPPPASSLLISWDSVGTSGLSSDTNLPTLRAIAALPESTVFAETATRQLAQQLVAKFLPSDRILTPIVPSQIQPLLADIMTAPTRFVAATLSNQVSWTLAVQLTDDRAGVWRSNLWLASNSELKLARSGSWTTLQTVTTNNLTGHLLGQLSTTNSPLTDSLFQAELVQKNWPLAWRPYPLALLDRVTISMVARGDELRPRIVAKTINTLHAPLVSWQIPTNSIREPLIGFTVLQGLQPLLANSKFFSSLGLTNLPSQMILWHQALSPFSVTATFPMGEVERSMDNFVSKLLPALKEQLPPTTPGRFEYNTNTHRLNWSGLPIVIPFMAPAGETNSLEVGLFPLELPTGKPAPAELFAQVTSSTNLLYYDWEITQERLGQWRPISQLYAMLSNQDLHEGNAVSELWLNAIQPKLGNSGSKLTQTGTNEITFTRSAPLGLTALELVTLARWVEPFPPLPAIKTKRTPQLPLPLLPPSVQPK